MRYSMLCVLAGLLVGGPVAAVFAEEEASTKPLESSIALGVTFNDGNTDNAMYTLGAGLTYTPSERSTLRLALDAAYGESDGDKNTDNAKAVIDYSYLISERVYAAFNTSYATDDIADLDYRWIVSPGIGYFLMKRENVTMTVDAGPALIAEKKSGESEEDMALRISERYERTMQSRARFWQYAEYVPHIDDFDLFVLNAEIGVEAPVSDKLNIRLVVKDTYDSNPAPGRARNDVSVIGALVYSLF